MVLNPPMVNERWRIALAALIAALAIPFLVLDTPATAGGSETADVETVEEAPAQDFAVAPPVEETDVVGDIATAPPVEVVIIEQAVSPDVSLLAARATAWGLARNQAVADGRVEVRPPAPSNTDLSLLPFVVAAERNATGEDDSIADPTIAEEASGEEPSVGSGDDNQSDESQLEDSEAVAEDSDADSNNVASEQSEGNEERVESGEGADNADNAENAPIVPASPVQVDGRVPPPNGGPTAAQWDALRNCESTHNYEAINNTGTYRGAYQFSQQTWDWVSGIHWPQLVGIDPAQADPAWQDIMAYTLFAMRGWDQWPICGQHLL